MLKNRSTLEKSMFFVSIIILLAIAAVTVIWQVGLPLMIGLNVLAYLLTQGINYFLTYLPLTVDKKRRKKLFIWGNILTLLLIVIIFIFARENFQHFSAIIIILLSYISALVMKEVEKTSPANKK